jgi:hypothetical protein
MEQEPTVEELKNIIDGLNEDIEELIRKNKTFCASNYFAYYARQILRKFAQDLKMFADDAWNWKWVIVLIAVELWRLHLDAQHWNDIASCLGGIASDLSNLLDAVDPHGPRG